MTTLEGRPAPPDLAQTLRHAALEAAMVAFIEGRTEDARELLKRAYSPAVRGTTPVYQLPWPILPDPPNVPADIQALAEATEAAMSTAAAAPWGQVVWGGSTAPAGLFRVNTAPTSSVLQNGATVDATGLVTVPAGFYAVAARMLYSLVGTAVELGIGTDTGPAAGMNDHSERGGTNVQVNINGSTLMRFTAAGKLGVWGVVTGGGTIAKAELTFRRLGAA